MQTLANALTARADIPDVPCLWLSFPGPALELPHDPIPHRHQGPAKDSIRMSATHSTFSPALAFHFAWEFLDIEDKSAVHQALPVMQSYAILRHAAATQPIFELRQRRAEPLACPELSRRRAWLMSCALLRFNFVYADFIRWLQGEYTNAHRDWASVFQIADSIRHIPIPPGNPPVDFERAVHLATAGAPIAGDFSCSFEDTQQRVLYNNHPPVQLALDEVRAKLIKEERLSYQIVFPRFLWHFIHGLFIAPISWVVRKPGEEGRICTDPSTLLHPKDSGAANSFIPKAGSPGNEDESPAVHYGTALTRLLTYIWNLRIAKPDTAILGHVDDISAAFHRILYHPAMGIAFASVFEEFLSVPVGQIFGGRSCPSNYMIPGELRAHMASVIDFSRASVDLASEIKLPPPLSFRQTSQLAKASADGFNRGMHHKNQPFHNSSFVDDNATAHWPNKIREAIKGSVLSAYITFGFPDEDRRPPPLNPKKWETEALSVFKYLGYLIDTHRMLVIWPLDKRERLAEMLAETWLNPIVKFTTPKQASQLLGLIQNGGLLSALSLYLVQRLQFDLNDHVSRAGAQQAATKRFWNHANMFISCSIRAELRILRTLIDTNLYHHAWYRSIGLLIKREVTAILVSDASYEGLGGLNREPFSFMWRLSAADLRSQNWVLTPDIVAMEPVPDADPKPNAHINVLEFVAIIINIWLLLKFVDRRAKSSTKQTIAQVIADNTSALSWLSYASRTKRTGVRNLARFLTQLFLHKNFPLQMGKHLHIAGLLNVDTDKLSRFSKHPSWAALMQDISLDLKGLTPYRVPSNLLLHLWRLTSATEIVDTSDTEMTRLWRPELLPLQPGWVSSVSMTSL